MQTSDDTVLLRNSFGSKQVFFDPRNNLLNNTAYVQKMKDTSQNVAGIYGMDASLAGDSFDRKLVSQ